MADRYEYYIIGADTLRYFFYTDWQAQTFTPSVAHKITSVKLKLYRTGSPGTLTVSIRATSAGHPTGGDLCSGTTNGNTLTDSSPGEWREITLGAGYDLDADTRYAIVCRLAGGNINNRINQRTDGDGTYAGGNCEKSDDSGDSWNSLSGEDVMFEDWGDPLPVVAPTVTTQATDSIEQTKANPKGNVTNTGGENPTRYIDYDIDSGAPYANSENCGVGGTGVYSSNLTGLIPGTKYYYRARAVNSAGTGTGSEMTFTTLSIAARHANMAAKLMARGML